MFLIFGRRVKETGYCWKKGLLFSLEMEAQDKPPTLWLLCFLYHGANFGMGFETKSLMYRLGKFCPRTLSPSEDFQNIFEFMIVFKLHIQQNGYFNFWNKKKRFLEWLVMQIQYQT